MPSNTPSGARASSQGGPDQPCIVIASEQASLGSRFREILVREGYNIRVGEDAEEALDLLAELTPPVAIIDADLSDGGARRVLDAAATSFPATAIILATDQGTEDDALQRTAFAAFDYLPKTCTETVMEFRVARALQMRRETTTSELGASASQDLQDHLRELSSLYSICQEVGKEVPLERTLQSITRLLAEGVRFSSIAVAEIWLDGVRYSGFPAFPERGTEVSAPIRVGDRQRGKLVVYACRQVRFSASESALVTNVARKIGYMVRRSELRRALYESENKHRRLVEAISEGIFWAEVPGDGVAWRSKAEKEAAVELCMQDMRVTDCNLRFASFYGRSSVQQCIGKAVSEFFSGPSHARAYFETILDCGRVVHTVERTDAEGQRVRVEMDTHLVRRGDRVIGIQGINIDRTDAVRYQPGAAPQGVAPPEQYEERLMLFKEAIQQCDCGVVLADLKGTIIYANAALADLVGRDPDGLVGDRMGMFQVPGQEGIEREMESATLSRGSWSGELLLRRADGELVPMRMVTSLIRDRAGKALAQLRVSYDLSEQRRLQTKLEEQSENLQHIVEQRTRALMQSERNYRFLYEHAPIGTVITTLTGLIVDANPATCALLKCPREELLEKNLAFLFRSPKQYQELMSKLSGDEAILDEEIDYETKDGGTVTVQQFSVLTDAGESGAQAIHFLKDITQAKQLAQEAESRQQQIGRAERLAALGQLIAGVAHELNNPLTAVLTYAHLLKRKAVSGQEPNRQLDLIVEAGDRCRQIVRDLLDFAREKAPSKGLADANDMIEHVLTMTANQILIAKIGVEKRLQDELPAVWVDRHQIEQVLLNVCLNAVEAMSEGGTLTAATDYSPNAQMVVLAIEDTGVGIPAEHLEKIFDPFFTTKAPGKGTGLGLAVSQRIIHDHGGHLYVESETGKGSKFTIELPAKNEPDAAPLVRSDEDASSNPDR